MRTGRPAKERESALEWLEAYMSRGPASVNQLKQDAIVGWHTIQKAKKELGIQSKKTNQGWIWYKSDVTELPQQVSINQSVLSQSLPKIQLTDEDELEESDHIQVDIACMKSIVDEMILAGKDYKETERSLISSCNQWPTNPPYAVDFIKKFAYRRYNGLTTEDI